MKIASTIIYSVLPSIAAATRAGSFRGVSYDGIDQDDKNPDNPPHWNPHEANDEFCKEFGQTEEECDFFSLNCQWTPNPGNGNNGKCEGRQIADENYWCSIGNGDESMCNALSWEVFNCVWCDEYPEDKCVFHTNCPPPAPAALATE